MNTKINTLPSQCPSCNSVLTVDRLQCPACSTVVQGTFALSTLSRLSAEEQSLIVSFIKASGSLKELAQLYHVSYPTIRNRIDELRDKVSRLEKPDSPISSQGVSDDDII